MGQGAHFDPLGEANTPGQRGWWTVKQLAEFYGLSRRSVYDAITAVKLVTHRFGLGRGRIGVADKHRID